MKIPKPPWYDYLDKKLEGAEWLVNTILIVVILLCVVMLFSKDRVAKTTVAVFLVSP